MLFPKGKKRKFPYRTSITILKMSKISLYFGNMSFNSGYPKGFPPLLITLKILFKSPLSPGAIEKGGS
jgi:hypothetical protein